MGVSAFFFLPALVAAFTSADEFHSVTKTRCPRAVSHFASRPSCVVLPDPSMPSTTKRRPGYVWGVASLFSMRTLGIPRGSRARRPLHVDGLLEQPRERRGVPRGSP